jgi:hypothetical protein
VAERVDQDADDGRRTKAGRPRPFFVWIHLYDPHALTIRRRRRRPHDIRYDGEIAYTDAQIAAC